MGVIVKDGYGGKAMTGKERSENARKAAKVRWSRSRPLSKRAKAAMFRRMANMTPEQEAKEQTEWEKLISGFANLYARRPME
jgi:hypothetical protein